MFHILDLEFTQEAKQCNITKPKKYCHDDGKMEKYATLEEAYVACLGNSTNPNNVCKMVTDYMCDGDEYWTCSGTIHASTIGSCTWLKKGNSIIFMLMIYYNIRNSNERLSTFLFSGLGQEVCSGTRNIPLALLAAIQGILFIFL